MSVVILENRLLCTRITLTIDTILGLLPNILLFSYYSIPLLGRQS